ncbi:Retrovirus-related Pol polyprotein from transposon RE2 [Vitis vinifera]|uniref:Retrovirus-related Pol polyprotein from transposon RE2 n=1 Tax=Vitis vinifera TaxID=29760 RepID=A0A438K518_VITVI|nr:Retrovirus-related Pol polyprotein from transposon RE2 [Vitis vinifera]
MNFHTQLTKRDHHEPTTLTQALKDHKWRRAMSKEYDALVKNGTWALVPQDNSQNLVGYKWIFRTKCKPDGSIDRFKARLVAKGFHQRPGIDYQDTFSLVVKPNTVCIVLTIAVSRGWSLRQLDLLVYVDDLILTGDNDTKVNNFITILAQRFSIKDLGLLTYFLGVEVQITRPDITFIVNKLSQYMHCPTSFHWSFVKRLLRYLVGTVDDGLQLYKDSNLNLHAFSNTSLSLQAFSNVDWVGDKDIFCSTSAYVVYLGKNPISWSSKNQQTITRSSIEAEYRLVANTTFELNFICYLLNDLGISLPYCPVIYYDNIGATQLCSNPIFHSRIKHVAIDFHFIKDQVQNRALCVAHVSFEDQLAHALTKPLPRQHFLQLKHKIGLLSRAPS